ncbi:RNA degradosome polyphosphate kinase [Thermicanus aegyptius]|uniref:RNA degradosome polyphosphate kinase n=1 Tax=Thermicanus aegyptius TaxID=94009 RepID=UPI00041FAB78|nr:RNA degradosome polyphosphate kinase [Thermicanus aegyptius]
MGLENETKDFDHPSYYINRELSWLSFNERVLEEARDEKNPLFERLKFLAITASNLDEFFMVRIAGLKDQVKSGRNIIDNKTRMSAREQWEAALERSKIFMGEMMSAWNDQLLPLLAQEGILFLKFKELNKDQKAYLSDLFDRLIYPVLTPMAVDASRPFPMLLNRSLNLAILIDPEEAEKEKHLFAFVQVPSVLPRFIEVPNQEGKRTYILLEELIRNHLTDLFRGKKILSAGSFRITRNADLTLNEEGAEDLLEEIEKELKKRKMGAAVRIEVEKGMHPFLRGVLEEWEEISPHEFVEIEGPLDLTFLYRFVGQSGFQSLRYPDLPPLPPVDLRGEQDIFEAIRNKDLLIHHPYESFEPVIHFVRQAAQDPHVLAIKQTLYRVGGDSPIVAALAEAAERGKQVTVLVELKARFDEEKNIEWAKKLEQAGCHVIYGLVGLKTHAKMILVVRQERDRLRRYVHLGTGNYNENTAKIYSDLSLFTVNEAIGEDVSSIFNQLSGYSSLPELHHLSVAPTGLRETFIANIEEVISHSTPERPGHIIAKMNSLTDKEMIKALYRASSCGVKIDLIIRGICCLRPGIPGISENIRVFSIVGRFLEHSRVYYFQYGRREKVFVSSADWMTRNLDRRVEALFPILNPRLKKRIIQFLEIQLMDNVKRRELMTDGTYVRVKPAEGEEPLYTHEYLYRLAEEELRQSARHPFRKF